MQDSARRQLALARPTILNAETGPRIWRLERLVGIEPTTPAWKAEVLPLNYSRDFLGAACLGPAGVQAFVHDPSGRSSPIRLGTPSLWFSSLWAQFTAEPRLFVWEVLAYQLTRQLELKSA